VVVLLDLFRLFLGVTVLSFAAFTDWQWRRAPNALWLLLAIGGVLALAAQAALDPAAMREAWRNLVFIPGFAALVYGLWYFGLIAGGADAKALMAIGVLLPFPVAIGGGFPLLGSPVPDWPLAVSVMSNALLLFLVVPLGFLVWNLAHGDVRLPHAVLGVRREAKRVRQGHVWPMEVFDAEGKRRTRFFPSRMSQAEVDELFDRLHALGRERVWVTPKVPFMLPLLAGFVAAFFVGDLMLNGMFALLR
jgi:preflagellin peptidase FlaK